MDKNLIMLEAKKELARREFFYFCHLTAPLFYKPEREFLVRLCNEMQSFYESDENALIINLPPRHGKSRTASMFVEWVLGRNQSEKIMTGSYNETLSTTFSKAVRNAIQEEKADTEKIIYSDIFPNVKIKQGDGAMNLWSLEGGYNNYLSHIAVRYCDRFRSEFTYNRRPYQKCRGGIQRNSQRKALGMVYEHNAFTT